MDIERTIMLKLKLEEMIENKALHNEIVEYKWRNSLYKKTDIQEVQNVEGNRTKNIIKEYRKMLGNDFAQDIVKDYGIPKNFEEICKTKKKREEAYFCFLSFPGTYDLKKITFEEFLNYGTPMHSESNGEGDFTSIFGESLEYTSLLKAGSLHGKIVREYKDSKKPFFDHDEVYKEAKKVLKRKINKKSKTDLNILVIRLNAYSENTKSITATLTRNYQYRTINKYHKILLENKKCGFKYGKIILSYGDFFEEVRIYEVFNFEIQERFKRFYNEKTILSSTGNLGLDEDGKKELKIFQKRLLKKMIISK